VNQMGSNLTAQVRNIAEVTTAVAKGDLSRKITVDVKGEILELKNTINTMVDQLNSFGSEVFRVAREVGSEGKLGGQADVPGVEGLWKDLTDSVNKMASNLTSQVRNIAEVTTAVANGDLDLKDAKELNGSKGESLFNLNATIDVDYKINARKSLTFNYSTVTNYPGVQQLTSLGNTFDLVSQISGNLELRPEEKRAFKLYYTVKSSDSENISISGEYDNYHSKFGYSINSTFNNIQNTSIANIGNSNSGQITFFILKNINDRYLSYSNSLAYQETPTLTNNKLILNNGITFNQSLTSSFDIIKSVFSASPILASSFSKYFYESSTVNVITFTYSDKLSFHPKGFLLNFFPLFNYSHSLGNNRSFSVNGEIKKSVFKTYGAIWLQAYDIFNSFKFYNNYIGSSYYQSVKYSNIHRYFILGLTYKFNNMK